MPLVLKMVILGLALAAAAVIAISLRRLYRAVKNNPEKPWKAAFQLSLCIFIALVLDERVTKLLPLPDFLNVLYNVDYAFKWELMALVATGILTRQFFLDEIKHRHKIRDPYFTKVMTLYPTMFFLLASAIAMLLVYPFLDLLPAPYDSHLHLLKYATFGLHFFFAWLLSICFLRTDYAIYKGAIATQDPNNELRNTTELQYFLADWPIVISLTLLGVFCAVHWLEHHYLGHVPWIHQFMHRGRPAVDPIDMWQSEEYFMSGAIAFQYLLSTFMWIILMWGFISLLDTKQQSLVVEIADDHPHEA